MLLRSKLLSAFVCASTAIIFALPANARWVKVSTSVTGEAYYFEDTQITRVNSTVRYWYKTVLPREDYDGVKSAKFLIEGNCTLGSIRELEGIIYNARGRKIGHQIYEGANEKRRRMLLSDGEGYMLQQACAVR